MSTERYQESRLRLLVIPAQAGMIEITNQVLMIQLCHFESCFLANGVIDSRLHRQLASIGNQWQ
ncbi:MAG: hypothetical protein ACK50J_20960 [Planctomyces sp.]